MWEIPLLYSAAFAKPSTFILNHLMNGIRARVPFDGSELVLDIPLRWRRTIEEAPGTVYVSPRSSEVWATEPTRLCPEMLRCQLVLYRVPATVDWNLRRL